MARVVRLDGFEVSDAGGPGGRAKGLLGRDGLDRVEGLWISPCRQVHTFGMRFPIDVVFLDRDSKVLHTVEGMRSGRMSRWVWRAAGALELASGVLADHGLVVGDVVEWDR